jgi:hypothetical protein
LAVLEAGDLKSLLEQFEASEAVNNPADMPPVAPVSSLPAVSNSLLVLSNQKIRDSLPQEVVEKIKVGAPKCLLAIFMCDFAIGHFSEEGDTRHSGDPIQTSCHWHQNARCCSHPQQK